MKMEQDPIAAVQDAAEEVTFGHDNSKKVKLADRHQKSKASALLIERALAYAAIVAKFYNADVEAKRHLVDDARDSKDRDAKKLLAKFKHLGGKPASNYAFLIQAGQTEKDPAIKQLLKETSDLLFKESSKEIIATFNSQEVANKSELADPVYLSESYGEIANNGDDPQEMLSYIESKFGADRVDDGVEFMLKSLGADISSPITSSEPEAFEMLGKNLSIVRSLNSGKAVLNRFVARLVSAHGINVKMSPIKLLTGLLNLSKQRFITADSIRDLYQDVVKQQPDKEVLMAQDLLTCCRNLSSELFSNEDARLRIIQSVEQLVDNLVDAEDEWLEAGEQ